MPNTCAGSGAVRSGPRAFLPPPRAAPSAAPAHSPHAHWVTGAARPSAASRSHWPRLLNGGERRERRRGPGARPGHSRVNRGCGHTSGGGGGTPFLGASLAPVPTALQGDTGRVPGYRPLPSATAARGTCPATQCRGWPPHRPCEGTINQPSPRQPEESPFPASINWEGDS